MNYLPVTGGMNCLSYERVILFICKLETNYGRRYIKEE